MSSFQFYDFYAIDRPLTTQERQAVDKLSSRFSPSVRRATFEYNYSDFGHDSATVLEKYFDILLHYSSWGAYRVMIKLPVGLVDVKLLTKYQCQYDTHGTSCVKIYNIDKNIVVDLNYVVECPEYWLDVGGLLDKMMALRVQLLAGDYRVLYMAWLHLTTVHQDEHYEEDKSDYPGEIIYEPLVPAGLKNLNVALDAFADFWHINPDLIAAASQNSKMISKKDSAHLISLLDLLTEKNKIQYLSLLLTDPIKAQQHLNKRLADFDKKSTSPVAFKPRSIAKIQKDVVKQALIRQEKEGKSRKKAHIKKMEKIGRRLSVLWESVLQNASLKTGHGYRDATAILSNLYDHAVYIDKTDQFRVKLIPFMTTFGKSVALRRRLFEVGIILEIDSYKTYWHEAKTVNGNKKYNR